MKIKFLFTLFICGIIYITLSSRSGGLANVGNQDRSGSPFSTGLCSDCHSGGSFSPSLTIQLKDSGGNTVSSYVGGQSYTLEFNFTAAGASGFGLQAVALLNSNNTTAGNLTSSTSPNSQISALNGRQYAEHSGLNSSGSFSFQWTAPSAGSGNVNIYGNGIAANGNGNTAGDQGTTGQQLTLTESVPTTISYNQSNYCQDGTDPTPSLTGTTGGTYSSSTGLTINATTGEIDLSTSTPGTYTVTYTYSGGSTTTTTVSVLAEDVASISYAANDGCNNVDQDVLVTQTGLTGGTYTASPTGLIIDSNTGTITTDGSTAGSYTISYTTNGNCPTTATTSFSIVQGDDASFSYSGGSFCNTATDPVPTIQGTSGGTFSSDPAGLALNNTTGEIDVSASAVDNYTVTYITTGLCPDTQSVSIQIISSGSAAFSYDNSSYCTNNSDPTPTITGIGGGNFSTGNGLVFTDNSGTIDLSATQPGSYTIRYEVSGSCPAVDSTTVTILVADQATIAYDSSTYSNCTANPTPTINGVSSGSFQAQPAGLQIDSNTGEIDLLNSAAGSYQITFISSGNCPDTTSAMVTITTCVSTQTIAQLQRIQLFPNPLTTDLLHISNLPAGDYDIYLYNQLGQIVYQLPLQAQPDQPHTIQLPRELKGYFSLQLVANQQAIRSFQLIIR